MVWFSRIVRQALVYIFCAIHDEAALCRQIARILEELEGVRGNQSSNVCDEGVLLQFVGHAHLQSPCLNETPSKKRRIKPADRRPLKRGWTATGGEPELSKRQKYFLKALLKPKIGDLQMGRYRCRKFNVGIVHSLKNWRRVSRRIASPPVIVCSVPAKVARR